MGGVVLSIVVTIHTQKSEVGSTEVCVLLIQDDIIG